MNNQTKKIIYVSILSVLIFVILPIVLVYGKYNEGMLWAIPFGIGMTYTLLLSIYRKPKLLKLLLYSFVVLVVITVVSVLIAKEGAICIFIFGLFILIPFYLGILIGYVIQKKIWLKNTMYVLIFATILCSATIVNTYNKSILVKDELVINMSQKVLWKQLTNPKYFTASKNFFFRNGVSHPNFVRIDTINQKQFLYCRYSNGIVLAPIIDYQEGRSFSFTFDDSIITMKEKNFYQESHTMHIKNHFAVDYGKFEIIPINDTSCKLIASTSFRHKFEPEFYTNFWVSYFVHQVHKQVLQSF